MVFGTRYTRTRVERQIIYYAIVMIAHVTVCALLWESLVYFWNCDNCYIYNICSTIQYPHRIPKWIKIIFCCYWQHYPEFSFQHLIIRLKLIWLSIFQCPTHFYSWQLLNPPVTTTHILSKHGSRQRQVRLYHDKFPFITNIAFNY